MFKKQNFKYDECVVILGTGTDLDGWAGRIIGKSGVFWYDTYIVDLGKIISDHAGHKLSAVALPESCLKRAVDTSNKELEEVGEEVGI
jgi:hypothetical protein